MSDSIQPVESAELTAIREEYAKHAFMLGNKAYAIAMLNKECREIEEDMRVLNQKAMALGTGDGK